MKIDDGNIEYSNLKNNYKVIGEGSGRIVYDLENGYVAKVAKNIKGLSQNKAEYYLSLEDTTGLFAKIIKSSNDFKYIVMEKAVKLKNFTPVFDYFKVQNKSQLHQIKDIQFILSKYHLNVVDINSSTSWGIVDGIPKIIDYGLTNDIYKEFYLKERLTYLFMFAIFMQN